MKAASISLAILGAIPAPAIAADWHDDAVALVRDEKSVVEAMFPQPTSLWVSMVDDGTPRDDFAEYLCLVLGDAGVPEGDSVVVSIWDASAMARGEMRKIGKGYCRR